MAGVAKFFNGHIRDKSNTEIDLNDEKYKGKVIGIYFSAHWCPPCRGFTPVLASFYNEHHENKNFEIIFVSSDRDEQSFNGYYKEMPWLALDFNERKKKEELSNKFSVSGIPKLVLLDGDSGSLICDDARTPIQNTDRKGEHFPWTSKGKDSSKNSSCLIL